jgi:hypothetical protein
MTPVYFLYSDEKNAGENFAQCQRIAPHAVSFAATGTIFESHKAIAEDCSEDRFYVVDGDNWILDRFSFEQKIDLKPRSVAVFRSKNPINGLVYGHGGIKLFSRDCFSVERLDRPDMTTTLADHYIKVNVLASEHRFNYTAFATWRTAFREAVKLSSGIIKNGNDQETLDRLEMWLNAGIESQYGYFAIQGARQGQRYAQQTHSDLNLVNDFAWLKTKFEDWLGV